MSRNAFKILAVIAMTVDHIALVFVSPDSLPYYLMRLLGRSTAPIMTFMLTEGFRHTKSRKKYILRLTVFALFSQPFFFVLTFGRPPVSALEFLTHWNVLFTFAVTLCGLCILQSDRKPMPKSLLAALCFFLAGFGDWSFLVPAWAVIFLYCADSFRLKAILFTVVSAVLQPLIYLREFGRFDTFSFQFGVLLALIPLRYYRGEQNDSCHAKHRRWFFYWFYPAHIVVLLVIQACLKRLL